MTRPAPESKWVEVCSVCELDWGKHLSRAVVHVEAMDVDGDVEYRSEARPVSTYDCIALLRIANQGPMGPAGATGPMGMTGASA